MKHSNRFYILTAVAIVAVAFGVSWSANSFTDVNATKYWGKTSLKDLTEAIDANFALLESGGSMTGMTFSNTTVQGTTTFAKTPIIHMTNDANAGVCLIRAVADKGDNAGDGMGINFSDGSGIEFQSDADSAGTLATKLTIGTTGIVTMKGGALLDNTTSANELNITETAVKVTGNFSATGTFGATGDATLTSSTATIGGRQAVVAHALGAPYSAATKLAIFTTNVTMHAGTVWTQALTYTTGILAAHATYTEDPGDVRPLYVNSMVTNEVQVTATADKNFCLTVIGIP